MWIVLLWPIIDNRICVTNFFLATRAWRILSYVMTIFMFVHFCPVLLQPYAILPKILTKCSLPHLGCCRVVHQLLVAWDRFASYGVYNGAGEKSNLIGIGVAQFFIDLRGMWMVLINTCSWMVRIFIACCITLLCPAPVELDCMLLVEVPAVRAYGWRARGHMGMASVHVVQWQLLPGMCLECCCGWLTCAGMVWLIEPVLPLDFLIAWWPGHQ